jgi:hypothetical protein
MARSSGDSMIALSTAISGEIVRRGSVCQGTHGRPCGKALPGPGLCDECYHEMKRIELEEKTKPVIKAEIPEIFQWAKLGENGLLSLCGPRKIQEAIAWQKKISRVKGPRILVLRGETGSGKTTLACALLRAWIAQGDESARFVSCEELSPDFTGEHQEATRRALGASRLVLDDLGQDVAGALPRSPLASRRNASAKSVIRYRHRKALPTIITTGLEYAQIDAIYGPDTERRITENAPGVLCMLLEKT